MHCRQSLQFLKISLQIRKLFSDDILCFSDQPFDNFASWQDLRDQPNTLTRIHGHALDITCSCGAWNSTGKPTNILVLELGIVGQLFIPSFRCKRYKMCNSSCNKWQGELLYRDPSCTNFTTYLCLSSTRKLVVQRKVYRLNTMSQC